MREIKIFIIVAIVTGVIYWGVEPFAHSQMHPHVESGNFEYKEFKEVKKGDAKHGEELVMSNCTACHSINAKGMAAPMDAVTSATTYGVNPPDLSNAGAIYDAKFLAAFIADPAKATKTSHKYVGGKSHPMPSYNWMSESDIADMVSFLQSIAKEDLTPKEVFTDACGRCHAVRYDNKVKGEKWTQIGQKPKFKYEKDSLAYDIKVIDYQDALTKYMGKLPPDLSIIIRARSEHFLETFIENPQSQLHGTAMPAVGLSEEGFKKVMQHLENVGDPSKEARSHYGTYFMIFFAIFAILAYLWKQSVWRKLH